MILEGISALVGVISRATAAIISLAVFISILRRSNEKYDRGWPPAP
jgi:hypothetical protein